MKRASRSEAKDPIDRLLQLAFLEGNVNTHGLYEKMALKKKPTVAVSTEASGALIEKLEEALMRKQQANEMPLTVGAFLQQMRSEHTLRPQEVFSRIGVSANIYRMLEQDRISPLKVSVESWKKLRELFRLSTDTLTEMIRRTHQLVWFEPSFKTTLARYDERKKNTKKSRAIESAARELYMKAILTLPEEEERKLAGLFRSLSEQ